MTKPLEFLEFGDPAGDRHYVAADAIARVSLYGGSEDEPGGAVLIGIRNSNDVMEVEFERAADFKKAQKEIAAFFAVSSRATQAAGA